MVVPLLIASLTLASADALNASALGPKAVQTTSPDQVARSRTWYEWCDCGKGLQSVTLWPDDDTSQAVSVDIRDGDTDLANTWIQFHSGAKRLGWTCDGMSNQHTDVNLQAGQWLSVIPYKDFKPWPNCFTGATTSGRLHLNVWDPTPSVSSVPFVTGTEGYACFKIPALLSTQAGSLLVFAEARTPTCDDFAQTEIVYKRSTDGGRSWGALKKLVDLKGADQASLGECGHQLVIGNIAPLQLRADSAKYPSRILVPYTRNNFRHWFVHSDDDGETFGGDRELEGTTVTDKHPDCERGMSYFGLDIDKISLSSLGDFGRWLSQMCKVGNPFHSDDWTSKLTGSWQFIGLGPPGGLQLSSGRILVPGFHAYIRGLDSGNGTLAISQLYNNFAVGHVLISDDSGDSWRLGKDWPVGEGFNENQLVELADGSVLANARSLSTGSPQWRVQARSTDSGDTFGPSEYVYDIQEPFNGCQGSTVGPGGPSDQVFVANPDPEPAASAVAAFLEPLGCHVNLTGRTRVSVWRSVNGGRSYPQKQLIDAGLSAQTSLQFLNGKLMLLYEQADHKADATIGDVVLKALVENLQVLLPSRFVVREVDLNAFSPALLV